MVCSSPWLVLEFALVKGNGSLMKVEGLLCFPWKYRRGCRARLSEGRTAFKLYSPNLTCVCAAGSDCMIPQLLLGLMLPCSLCITDLYLWLFCGVFIFSFAALRLCFTCVLKPCLKDRNTGCPICSSVVLPINVWAAAVHGVFVGKQLCKWGAEACTGYSANFGCSSGKLPGILSS